MSSDTEVSSPLQWTTVNICYHTTQLFWHDFPSSLNCTHIYIKLKLFNNWRDKYHSYSKSRFIISIYLHMENHFIPFQCVVHMHIMVFTLWNHRGVRIVSFSAFPYWRRIGRTGATKIRQILCTQRFFICVEMLIRVLQNNGTCYTGRPFLRYDSSGTTEEHRK